MHLITIEIKRLRRYIGLISVNMVMVIMFVLNARQFLEGDLIEFLWVLLPFISLAINRGYYEYMNHNWLVFVLSKQSSDSILRTGFFILSLIQNLPIALTLMYIVSGNILQGVMYWFVLDIVGYFLFCIRAVSYQSSGMLVAYIFMIPLVYPWVILGVMASLMQTSAVKFIAAIWLLKHTVGIYFFQLCCKVGQVTE